MMNPGAIRAAVERRLYDLGLLQRLLLAELVVLGFLFGGLTLVVSQWADSLRSRIEEERYLMALAVAGELDAALDHAIGGLQQLAILYAHETAEADRPQLHAVLEFTAVHSEVFTGGIAITNSAHKVVASDQEHSQLLGADLSPSWPVSSQGPKPLTWGFRQAAGPVVIVAIPLLEPGQGGHVVGLMDVRDSYISQILVKAIRLGGTGHADIVDETDIALFSTESEHILVSSDHPTFYRQMRNQGGSGIGIALHEKSSAAPEEEHLMAFVSLRTVPWSLAIGTGASEAFAPVRQVQYGSMGLLGLLASVGFLATVFVGRRLVEPVQALSQAAQRVAAGERQQPIRARWGGEIGELARSLETMRRELEAWGSELEQRVLLRTEELAERTGELSATAAVAEAAASSLLIDQVLERAADTLARTLPADAVLVYLLDEAGARPRLWAHRGFPEGFFREGEPVDCSDCLASQAGREGRTVSLEESAHQPQCVRAGFAEVIAAPVGTTTRTLGAVCLLAREPGALHSTRQVLEVTRYQLGTALENAILYEALQQRGQHLQRVLEKVLSAQEEERRRVSLELHDVIGQALTALALSLEQLGSLRPRQWPQVREELRALHKMSTDTLGDLRRLALALRPSALDDLGLVPAIRRYADQYLKPSGVAVTITQEGLDDRLPPSIEVVVFRVVQEAINNIARHSRATEATVTISHIGETVVATVADNGIGFGVAYNGSGGGVGLVGMRERAELVGGQLTIVSQPGRGTTVSLEVPLGDQGRGV